MKPYIQSNRDAYEAIAHEFQVKRDIRRRASESIVEAVSEQMKTNQGSTILELGPGSGEIAHLLTEDGYDVTAIEFSPLMAELAAKTAPRAHVIVDEFLGHDFGSQHFDGIVGVAFIHLFTPEDALKVMSKIASLLAKNGVLYLSTTKHAETASGYIAKDNFENNVKRYRVQYTPASLEQLVRNTGFTYETSYYENGDPEADRTWMSIFCRKN